MLLLSACETVNSNPIPPAPRLICPALKSYTPEEQRAAADELAGLPPAAILVIFVADYLTLRDRIRAACPANAN